MNQLSKIVSSEDRVKEIAADFKNGHFDFIDRRKLRQTKQISTVKETTTHHKKGDGSCFNLNLPPNVSAMSNDLLRSGLFSSSKRVEPSDEAFLSNVPIATIGNSKMLLSGYILDQIDYQVYETLVKEYKVGGVELEIKLVDLVSMVGWERGGNQVESLIMSLKKLNSARIEIDTNEYQYFGGLVDRAVFDKATGMVNVKLGAEIAKMYAADNWTMLKISDRSLLGKNMLARWLYNFMMTHKSPFPYKLDTLRELSDNLHIAQNSFNGKLKKACALINEKLGWELKIMNKKLYIKKLQNVEDIQEECV